MDRLERIAEDVSEIKVILARQELTLAEHIRRTEAAEAQVDELKTFVHEVRTHIKGIRWLGALLVAAIGVAKTLGII